MAAKNYTALIAAAAVDNGFDTVTGYDLLCDGMLNDSSLDSLRAVELDSTGAHVLFVAVNELSASDKTPIVVPYVVCDSMGKERIYKDSATAITAAVKTGFKAASTSPITLVKADSTKTVGDPVAALKSSYVQHFKEDAAATLNLATMAAKIAAGVALGWSVSTGTPERSEYDSLVKKSAAITAWKTKVSAKLAALAVSLTASGVDPTTLAH